jgi:hypothetical protein
MRLTMWHLLELSLILSVADRVGHLDRFSNVRRIAQQMERGGRSLRQLGALAFGAETDSEDIESTIGEFS